MRSVEIQGRFDGFKEDPPFFAQLVDVGHPEEIERPVRSEDHFDETGEPEVNVRDENVTTQTCTADNAAQPIKDVEVGRVGYRTALTNAHAVLRFMRAFRRP